MMMMMCCLPLMGMAQVAKYCMTYADCVANKWTPVEKLTEGRTQQVCQLKVEDNEFKFKTGDKQADAVLKKDVFAVMYGNNLYINCRNLREDDVPLDVSGYAQAYRYAGKKLCVAVYHGDDGAFLLGLGADVASLFVATPMSIGLRASSTALWLSKDKLSTFRCFLIENNANAKGRYPVTRMNDEFMEKTLAGSPLLKRYQAVSKKKERQSAANILPILTAKGLLKG